MTQPERSPRYSDCGVWYGGPAATIPNLTTRLEKAAFLVLLRPIENVGEDHYRIGSEDGLRFYDVIKGHCQCSDYLRHGAGHPCKHRLALSLHQQLETTINLGAASDQESQTTRK